MFVDYVQIFLISRKLSLYYIFTEDMVPIDEKGERSRKLVKIESNAFFIRYCRSEFRPTHIPR